MSIHSTIRPLILFIVASALAASAGCGGGLSLVVAPRTDVGAAYQAEQIEQAIITGLARKGWMVIAKEPGQITAEISRQRLTAKVLVRFNEAGWVIDRLETSEGFKFRPDPAPTGSIHRRYNLWVESLDAEIRAALTRTLQTPVAPPAAQEAPPPTTEAAAPATPPTAGSTAPADPSGAPAPAAAPAAAPAPAATPAAAP